MVRLGFEVKRRKESKKEGEEEVLMDILALLLLTWMEYMMILKQRTANVFPSHREWLSKCLREHRQEERKRWIERMETYSTKRDGEQQVIQSTLTFPSKAPSSRLHVYFFKFCICMMNNRKIQRNRKLMRLKCREAISRMLENTITLSQLNAMGFFQDVLQEAKSPVVSRDGEVGA